ncbi:MAG TPA: DUF2807 domain-containing protein [Rhizomicrobium sp.]|nr:DUF2807 domain-containing protein [Rhizomicrobium sp.]
MHTKLAILALSSFAISAACLGGAFAFGSIGFGEFGLPRCDLAPTGQSVTRDLAWDGSDSAGIAVPANVHYRRGQGDRVVVTGDSAVVPHVEIVDGSVQLDCRPSRRNWVRLEVTLPGRPFKSFSLAGLGDMTLDGIDQPDLQLHLAGSGNIAASGKTSRLELHIAGAGDAKLGQLLADRVTLHVAGSGNIDVAPKDDLDAHIVGSGTLMLHSEPHSIETHIIGSGRIIHPDGSVSSRHA